MPKGEIPLVATSEGRLLLFTLHFIEFHFIFACWQRRFSCFSEDRKMLKMRQPAAGYRILQDQVRSVNTVNATVSTRARARQREWVPSYTAQDCSVVYLLKLSLYLLVALSAAGPDWNWN